MCLYISTEYTALKSKVMSNDNSHVHSAPEGSDQDAAYLDKQIDALQNNREPTVLDNKQHLHGSDRYIAKLSRAADSESSAAKALKKTKLGTDETYFPVWYRKACDYFNASGTKTLVFMNQFTAPELVSEWQELDRQCRQSNIYHELTDEWRTNKGMFHSRFSNLDSMTRLNSAYLVTIDNTPGLEEAQRITLESSLELTRLNNCLLSSHESSLDVATRYIFFSVANHFMMNTAETRLERLTYILTGIAPSTDLSIKEYYNKLMNEVRIYNLMANPHQIPRYLCLELFKISIINVYGQAMC